MASQPYQHHNGTIISDKTPTGPDIELVGYAVLPLLLTILFFIFFIASGKLIL